MTMLVRYTKDDKGFKVGDIVAVSEEEGQKLVESGTAEDTQAPVHRTPDLNPAVARLGVGEPPFEFVRSPLSNTLALSGIPASNPAAPTPSSVEAGKEEAEKSQEK